MSFLRTTKFEEINNILKYLPFTITASIGNKFELIKIFSIIKNYYDKNNIQPYKYNKNKNIHRLKKNTIIDNIVINEIALNTLFMYSMVGTEFHKVTTYN